MKLAYSAICASLVLLGSAVVALADPAESSKETVKPCTIRNPSTGHFFDLNSIAVQPIDPKKKALADVKVESWHARGFDYNTNFTINFCEPVVEVVEEAEGLERSMLKNISAFYKEGKKTYSLGRVGTDAERSEDVIADFWVNRQRNSELVFRGSKLVLNYTHGSPCGEDEKSANPKRRKSTIISLLCQNDVVPGAAKVSLAFVGADEDKCAYFFEARSAAACAGIETTPSNLGPGGVFGVILMIAIMAYFVGGCVYQRTVQHQRGWRQLPNYSMWAGIWGAVSDFFIIITSSCTRFLPSQRGYSRLSLNGNGYARGRQSEDENRLIDDLDENWDD